jgi:hypothetical protein
MKSEWFPEKTWPYASGAERRKDQDKKNYPSRGQFGQGNEDN